MSIFPESITRDGCTCTREEMERAFNEWIDGTERTALALKFCLLKHCKDRKPDHVYEHGRTADAVLQIARKAGKIIFKRGRWQRYLK